MKLSDKDLKKDNLKDTEWIGVVESTEDPLFQGRCKIRVFGKFDGRINPADNTSEFIIPTESLPWSRPGNIFSGGSVSGGGSFSVPKLNSTVKITFDNGNIYSPIYHYNVYHSDEVQQEIEATYQNSHVLLYDTAFELDENGNNSREGEHVKVFFTEEKGLVFDYSTTEGSSKINIKPDNSIEIKNPNGNSIVMFNDGNVSINCENANVNASRSTHINSPKIKLGENAIESVIKGDTFKAIFDSHIHSTGVGPSGPPLPPSINNTYLSTKNTTD